MCEYRYIRTFKENQNSSGWLTSTNPADMVQKSFNISLSLKERALHVGEAPSGTVDPVGSHV